MGKCVIYVTGGAASNGQNHDKVYAFIDGVRLGTESFDECKKSKPCLGYSEWLYLGDWRGASSPGDPETKTVEIYDPFQTHGHMDQSSMYQGQLQWPGLMEIKSLWVEEETE